jgi:hypothetical protein
MVGCVHIFRCRAFWAMPWICLQGHRVAAGGAQRQRARECALCAPCSVRQRHVLAQFPSARMDPQARAAASATCAQASDLAGGRRRGGERVEGCGVRAGRASLIAQGGSDQKRIGLVVDTCNRISAVLSGLVNVKASCRAVRVCRGGGGQESRRALHSHSRLKAVGVPVGPSPGCHSRGLLNAGAVQAEQGHRAETEHRMRAQAPPHTEAARSPPVLFWSPVPCSLFNSIFPVFFWS